MERLPEGAYVPRDEERRDPPKILDAKTFTEIKDGAYAERDGKIVMRNGNSFDLTSLAPSSSARTRGMMAVRDTVRLVFRAQLDDSAEDQIIEARKLLDQIYENFVWKFGPLLFPR